MQGDWDTHLFESDAHDLADRIMGTQPTALVLDSYSLGPEFTHDLRAAGIFVTVIIDEATPLFEGDLYVAPGFDFTRAHGLPFEDVLTGPDFVLIRDEVRGLKAFPVGPATQDGGGPLHLMCLLGGTDPGASAAEVLKAALSCPGPMKIEIWPASPGQSLNWQHFENGIEVIFCPPSELALQSAMRADCVISAAGVSSWELVHLGVDLALIQLAPNQETNYRGMVERNWAQGLGVVPDWDAISLAMRRWLTSRSTQSRGPHTFRGPDGLGAQRALNEMEIRIEE